MLEQGKMESQPHHRRLSYRLMIRLRLISRKHHRILMEVEQGLLTLAKEYYDGNGMDEEQTYRKPWQNRGDDLLIEDKDFAVVYNGSVGGTYEVFLKHTEQEVRDHITRYGIGRASEDVKAVAREMTAEEFSELAQRKMPIFQMPNGGLLNLQYNKDKDSLDVGTFQPQPFYGRKHQLCV